MKRSHIFEADDGTTFDTAAECKAYEERTLLRAQLCELTYEQIDHAFDRTYIDLANAIERAGNIIAAKRRESGELKRKAKTSGWGARPDAEKPADAGALLKGKEK